MATLISGDAKLVVKVDTDAAIRQVEALDDRLVRSERSASRRQRGGGAEEFGRNRGRRDSSAASPGGGTRPGRSGDRPRNGVRGALGAAAALTAASRNPALAASAGLSGLARQGLAFAGPIGLGVLGVKVTADAVETLLPAILSALARVDPDTFGKAEARAAEVSSDISSFKNRFSAGVDAASKTQAITATALRLGARVTAESVGREFEDRYAAARAREDFNSVMERQIRQQTGAATGATLAQLARRAMSR